MGTTDFVDQGPAQGKVLANEIEPLIRVLKREYDAGATSRKLFEEYQFSKLAALDTFTDTPDVYAKAAKPDWDSRFAAAVDCTKTLITSGKGAVARYANARITPGKVAFVWSAESIARMRNSPISGVNMMTP